MCRLPFCSSPVALPALFRLWRGKGTTSQVELAAQMPRTLAAAFPGRDVHGTGDAAFHGESLIVAGTTWTTRLPANAVLYGPRPPRTGKRGRPRVKGHRLGTCAQITASAIWADTVINVYGHDTAVQIATVQGLWHGSFKTAPGRVVLVRDPGSPRPMTWACSPWTPTPIRPVVPHQDQPVPRRHARQAAPQVPHSPNFRSRARPARP